MTAVSATMRGASEFAVRLSEYPEGLRNRLIQRITEITEELEGASQAAAPVKTGKLRGEITDRVYSDSDTRVAGYVSVYSQDNSKEYAKAGTLEYGSDKARRRFERVSKLMSRLHGAHKRVVGRSSQVHIRAFRYLRGPFEAMEETAQAAIEAEVAQFTEEQNG